MKKRLLSILYCQLLIIALAHAQTTASTNAAILREQAFLHTDRNFYLAGEIVWLKMYCVISDTTNKSAIGYVDLYNAGGQPIQQIKLLLDTVSNGYIQLPDSISSGTYTLRAYTRNMEQYGWMFEKNIQVMNTTVSVPHPVKPKASHPPADTSLHLQTILSNATYGKRRPVDITVNTFQTPLVPIAANLSMSVYKLNELEQPDNPTIQSLRIPSDAKFLTRDSTQIPEINGQVLTGKITDKKTNQPLSVPIFLTITSSTPRFYCTPSSDNGEFAFELQGYSGEANAVLQAAAKNYQITVGNTFSNFDRTSSAPMADTSNHHNEPPADSALMSILLEDHIDMQVMRAYYGDSMMLADDHFTDSTVFFGKPDEQVLLDDYTRFNTLEEVFREFVKTVMVRKSNDTLHLHTLDNLMTNPKFFEQDPLILLDGVPVFDNKRLFVIDPLKIKKVSVLARKVFYPGQLFHGVVSLQTYTGDMAGYKLDANALVADYNGTEVPLKFFSPSYDQNQSPTLPDKRNLLYWNPTIKTDANGSTNINFYTGDIPGKYCVVLQGLTASGEPCCALRTFVVE